MSYEDYKWEKIAADYNSFLALGYEGYGSFAGPYTVRFDLGNSYDLTGFQLWNNAGFIENDGEGVNSFTLNFYDSSLNSKGSFSNNAQDILASQSFNFTGLDVKVVDFVVNSRHFVSSGFPDRQYVTFHEIKFTGTPVIIPEPVSSALFIVGGATLGFRMYRKKKTISS